mmetsp:Transcript_13946/g.52301  ORF Transcript_13946/g.52301 Transcript_13946/m.52301 type:complete len:207 (+) Transcript_13946:542-1162(+)
MSISLSKCPMLPTIALFFILAMCSTMMMSLLPVVVMKISAVLTQSSMGATWNPSMAACRAQMGSISETMTRAPAAFMACAEPLPTSPKPATNTVLDAIITSVARMIPSGREWRQPYRLSNLHLVTESLTLIAGNRSSPAFCISYNRFTPVVVSSETPTQVPTMRCHRLGSFTRFSAIVFNTSFISALFVVDGSGIAPLFSNSSSAL